MLSFFQKKQPPKLSVDKRSDCSLRVLFVLPCSRTGATGRYTQILAENLEKNGCAVLVLTEGGRTSVEQGVEWVPLDFEGPFLSSQIRKRILLFAPDIVYVNGVRSKAQRAALEATYLTGAKLVMHSEDDDVQVYAYRNGSIPAEFLTLLDKHSVGDVEVANFLSKMDWLHTWRTLKNPSHDRWIEPVTRAACYHLASAHTSVWKPFQERLKKQYRKPTLVVPPVCEETFFSTQGYEQSNRACFLSDWGISSKSIVFFVAGAVYPYSDEFEIFIKAMNLAKNRTSDSLVLVVSGSGSKDAINSSIRNLSPEIPCVNMGAPKDKDYLNMLKSADIICSPGICDDFNLYRLPSRLVKAMAMGKPVLTSNWGFGASLKAGMNAFLTEGEEPNDWAKTILVATDFEKRNSVGRLGKKFAEEHFKQDVVSSRLLSFLKRISKD